jgi:hypothetical protein
MIASISPGAWNWVAIGTLALALATFVLALYNRKIVAASQEQLRTSQRDLEIAREQTETAREALQAQTAPILANVPWGLKREATRYLEETGEERNFRDASRISVSQGADNNNQQVVWIEVPFRNVGNGVAIITSAQVMIGGVVFETSASVPILPPGEIGCVQVDAHEADTIFERALSLAVDGVDFAAIVGFADAGGTPRGAISMDVHREAPNSPTWRVRQLHIGDLPDAALNHPTLSSLPL